jgi:cobalt transporter subunit CbtA
MIGRVLLAALLAGIAAGVIMGAIQHVRLTPLILAAEVFEHGGAGAAETATIERTFYTTISTMMAGAAYAAILAGVSLLSGVRITSRTGMIWGLCGFLATTLAPATELPPELPGMPAGDLAVRQLWWAGTIVATGIGLYLIAMRREIWAITAAIIIIALPHAIGEPIAATHESAVPAGLAAAFAANAIAAGAVFWCFIGLFLGIAFDKFAKEIYRP